MTDERKTFGTVALDAPITREDFERAVRALHLSDLDQHALLLRLAAQVVALTEELDRRLPAAESSVAAAVGEAIPETLDRIRASDARATARVWLDTSVESKYDVANAAVPCDELMPLCQARCCKLDLPLSTLDLDEGVIRWDYGQPYKIRQRASDGYCVHNDPASHGCTVHAHRPAVCRRYDCRDDARIWIDFENRIPAPPDHLGDGGGGPDDFQLMERVKLRAYAEAVELNAITHVYPDDEPHTGPAPMPRPPRRSRP